jgi:diguanylate cyclase (GGDEF)-like protein
VTAPRAWIHRVDDPFDGVDGVRYESDTTWALIPVSGALAIFYVAFAALHHSVFAPVPGAVMDAIAVVSSLVAVAVGAAAWRRRIPDQLSHAAMTLLVAVTTANATAHLLITGDPQETVGFMFLLVGIGVVLLRRAWLVPSAVGIWACWAFGVGYLGGSSVVWGHWTFYMLTASGLGAVVVLLRRRSIDVANTALRQAMRAATEDTATTLSNRRGLEMRSRELVAIARRRGEIVHCTFLDVDGLKAINDERGHDAGDRVILAVAQAIRATCRASDVVARWGGDEFVVVGLGAGDGSHHLEERVAQYLAECHPYDETLTGLHISVGRAELAPWEDGDIESLLWKADHDMYQRRAQRPRGERTVFLPDGAGPFEL